MKLIVERLEDQFFVYRENEKLFKKNEVRRKLTGTKIEVKSLDDDCLLSSALADGDYIVVEIK